MSNGNYPWTKSTGWCWRSKWIMHSSFSQAFLGSSGRLTQNSSVDAWTDFDKLWLQPSSLKALNIFNITYQNSPDFTGKTSYLAEANTEYLFIGTGSVTNSTSQTLFPSSTIKMSIIQYQVVDNYGSMKTFYMSHSCRNCFSSSPSVKKI